MSYYDDCHVAMCQLHSGPSNRQEGIRPLARTIPLDPLKNKIKFSIWRWMKRQIYGLSFISLYHGFFFLEMHVFWLWNIYTLATINRKKVKEECPMIEGNADMYGIGIRVAIYLQMVYTALVQCLSPKNMALVGPINIWFLFALLVVMFAQIGANIDMHPAGLCVEYLLGYGLKHLVLGPVFREIPEALAHENQFTSLSRVVVGGLWLGCSSNLWWSVYSRTIYDTNECYPVGWDWVYYVRAINILEWCDFATLLLPQLWTITITVYLTLTRLDVESQYTCRTRDFPSKLRIFLDCLFIFPSGDLNWLIYGVSISLETFPFLQTNVYYACVGCAQ